MARTISCLKLHTHFRAENEALGKPWCAIRRMKHKQKTADPAFNERRRENSKKKYASDPVFRKRTLASNRASDSRVAARRASDPALMERAREKWRQKNKRYSWRPKHALSAYKSNAHQKDLEFRLGIETIEEMITQPCVFCSATPKSGTRNGIDRIDSSIGYVPGNIQTACHRCNVWKSDYPEEGFLDHIKAIALFQSTGSSQNLQFCINEKRRYWKQIIWKYKQNAEKRNLEFSLSGDESRWFFFQPCFYCGLFLPEHGSGIDRYNNRCGYIQGNCVPCCTLCNRMKNDLEASEFIAHVRKIAEHRKLL